MKKKFISLILLAALCLSLAPSALAEASPAPECICEAPCAEGAFFADCPVCSAEGAQLADCAKYSAPEQEEEEKAGEDTDEDEKEQPAEESAQAAPAAETAPAPEILPAESSPVPEDPVPSPSPSPAPTAADVQALIDALPAPESITAENRAEAEAKLTAIDEARLALSDEAHDTLDFTRYEAAVAALNTLDGTPDASEPQLLENATNGNLDALFKDGCSSITLTEDIDSFTSTTYTGGFSTITLDLNGHKLSNSSIHFRPTGGNLRLIIKNSQSTGEIANTTIYLEGGYGEISRVTANGVTVLANGATVTFDPQSGSSNTINAQNGSKITINSGSFNAVTGDDSSSITITGGTFAKSGDNATVQINGSANISGGTFNGKVMVYGGTVSGGTFNAGFVGNGISVSGGTFNSATLPNSTVIGGTFGYITYDLNQRAYLYKLLGKGYVFVDKTNNNTFKDASQAKALSDVTVIKSGFSLSVTSPITSVVVGTSSTLTATTSGADGYVTYKWYTRMVNTSDDNYTQISNATGNSLTVNPESAGSYFYLVVATDSTTGYTAAAETYAYYVYFEIDTAPTAKTNLSYTGEPQTLINKGTATLNATIYYSLSEDGDFSTELPKAENAGTYTVYYYAELNGSRTGTEQLSVTIAPCDPATYNAYIKSFNFTYGEYAAPAVTDTHNYNTLWSKASSVITYYWNTASSSTTGGTAWNEAGIRALNAGTYYVYAVFAESNNFKAYTTPVAEFNINKADPDPGITAIPGLTYDKQSHLLINKKDLSSRGYTVKIEDYNSDYSGKPYTIGEDGLPYGTNAGTYWVYYSIKESTNYKAGNSSIRVVISPITLNETTLEEYTYGDAALSNGDAYSSPKFEVKSVSGVLPGDEVTVTGELGLSLTGKNAGTYTCKVQASSVKLAGKDSSNYKYEKPDTVTLTVKKKPITINFVNLESKEYDGTTVCEVKNVGFNGLVTGDYLSYNTHCTATAVFASAEPGNNISFMATVTLKDTPPANNYVLQSSQFTGTYSINLRKITAISGISVSKTYDGTSLAVPDFSNAEFTGLLPAHEGKLSASGSNGAFASKNVGSYNNIAISNVALTGEAAKYYQLTTAKHNASGSITPKEITVTGITAANKTYDGTADAVIDCSNAEINGKLDGDSVSVASAVGAFANINVVADNSVNLSQIMLSGNDKDNYALSAEKTPSVPAQILPRAVTLKSESFSKPYDGLALTNGTGGVSVTEGSMATGETLDYTFSGSQTAVGTSRNIFTAATSATANAANYAVTYDYGALTVTLPADLDNDADALTPDTVKPTDRDKLEDALEEVNGYLDMSPSDEEKKTLNEKKAHYEELLRQLDDKERAEKAAAAKAAFLGIATGDESNLALWLVLAALSVVIAGAAIIVIRKKK